MTLIEAAALIGTKENEMTDKKCNACGIGTRGDPWGLDNCSYCGAKGPEAFTGSAHVHKLGMRVNGSAECVGHRHLGCTYSEYDSQWGAGIFNDWPRGHHKPYGS
jgi:hypothetical protein